MEKEKIVGKDGGFFCGQSIRKFRMNLASPLLPAAFLVQGVVTNSDEGDTRIGSRIRLRPGPETVVEGEVFNLPDEARGPCHRHQPCDSEWSDDG